MLRKRVGRSESEEKFIQEARKKRKLELQRIRRASLRETGEPGPSSMANHQDSQAENKKTNKDKERKSLIRQNETVEQREERLRKDRERKARKRAQESESQAAERRANDRREHAESRVRETSQERRERQTNDRILHVELRQSELLSERALRLQREKELKSVKRENETVEEYERRLENDRNRHQETFENESIQDYQNRLENARVSRQRASTNLTEPERQERLLIRNEKRRENRRLETSEQRQARLNATQARKERKNLENPEYSTDLDSISTHYVGNLNVKCNKCKGKHFEVETHDKNFFFTSCCEKGKVDIPAQYQFPDELKSLFKNEHLRSNDFKNNIRGYMKAMSFGSIITREIRFNGGGPYTYRQYGDFLKKFNAAAHPDPDKNATYGQLFMIEADKANGIRTKIMDHLDASLIAVLDKIIRDKNPFAKSYMMLKEEEEKARLQVVQNNVPMPEFKLLFCLKDNLDKRRFNPPRVNEVAVLFEQGVDGEVPRYEVCVNEYGKKLITLKQTHQSAEPLLFTLFYPTGQLGWHPNYQCNNQKITCAEYVKYKLYDRDESDSPFCPILYGGKSFQEWIVTQYINIDRDRLDYIKNNVSEHLAENYDYLEEYLNQKSAETGLEIGRKFVLPSSYMGSPRYMSNAYDDALTLTKTYGKPDLFITMTCNPNWREIKENLKTGQTASDRPDLVARVFRLKYKSMIEYTVKSEIYGKVKAYTGSIEFQKRGLPHLHLLIILDKRTKLDSKETIDKVIRAEIPDKDTETQLYIIIVQNNMHQCKKLNQNGAVSKKFPCIENSDNCSKKFPKPFLEETRVKTGGYANYRRRNNNITHTTADGQILDNRHVVSYTPQLSLKFNCHINVEHVADIEVVKYLHKYVFKGVDQALIEKVSRDGSDNQLIYDEIEKYVECRYLSAPEAAWRTLGYEIIVKSHTVERLEIHEEGKQFVFFKKNDSKERVEMLKRNKKSKLMAFFELNQTESTDLLYTEVSKHYTWDRKTMKWNKRLSHFKTVGRIYNISPKNSEVFHLRLLLIRIRGPKSFEDLRTVDGVVHPTYKSSCLARGYIKDDEDYINAMAEASFFKMPKQLRFMFSMLLLHCAPAMPNDLYLKFRKELSEDCVRKFGESQGYEVAYSLIEKILNRNGSSFSNFQMNNAIEITEEQILSLESEVELDNKNAEFKERGDEMLKQCNCDQKSAIQSIIKLVSDEKDIPKCVFLDGPGGTGKTFVYKTVYNIIKGRGKGVVCMAFTGIAATLLPEGSTVHTTFKFGLEINNETISRIRKDSKAGADIVNTTAFIIDEASMISKHMLEAIDRSLQELTGKRIPFGGKIMLLGGDFRQILPIKENATPQQTVQITIKGSHLWRHFHTFKLSRNMRAGEKNLEFANHILQIGEGKLNDEKDQIKLPIDSLTKLDLINEVFGNKIDDSNKQILANRSILAPLNVEVDDLNAQALSIVRGEECVYYSRDEIKEESNEKYRYMIEVLNSLGEANFPKSELKLKKNAVVMILRNLDLKEGLCNGTRLRVLEMKPNVIKCECLMGEKQGKIVFLPRITLESSKNLIIPFYRNQFPIRLAFAMTINKSQGQTFEKIGLKLNKRQVFSHGQLYVAISRVQNWESIKIQIEDDKSDSVTNIVYKNVL